MTQARSVRAADESAEPSTVVADENIRAVARIQAKAAQERTIAQRLTDTVADVAGREWAVGVHAVFFALWIVVNLGITPIRPFDPFPFTLLTTVVSLEAIFLALFVLSSQQRLTRQADRRAHLDLQVNLLSEQEMTLVLQMLKEVCDHLGLRHTIQSRKFLELARRTDVGELAEHLDRTIGGDSDRTGTRHPSERPHPCHKRRLELSSWSHGSTMPMRWRVD